MWCDMRIDTLQHGVTQYIYPSEVRHFPLLEGSLFSILYVVWFVLSYYFLSCWDTLSLSQWTSYFHIVYPEGSLP